MRTLSSTLLAAQKSASALPYLKVEVRQRIGGVTRLAFSRLYTGAEPDYHHAATMPGDGSLVRTRGDPSSYQLYYQRVTSPGPGSNFGAWTGLGTVSSVSGIALCSRSATVLLFYVGTDQRTIYCRESTDYGATLGSPVAVTTAGAAVGWLAAALNGSGVVALFYTVGGTVYGVKRSGGVWGSPSAWGNGAVATKGIATTHQGDWNLAVAGQDAGGVRYLWTCLYGDGYSQSPGTWSGLMELHRAEAGSNLEFRCPSLAFPDVFRLFFVESYSGSPSYARAYFSHSLPTAEFVDNLWREPVPFNLEASYGPALAHSTSQAWLSTPSGVWQATLSPTALELTDDLMAGELSLTPQRGQATITVRNDDGRYNSPGTGSLATLQLGAEVSLSPGYRTTAGAEISSGGPSFWIEGWEHSSQGGQALFHIYAQDGWELLRRWRARRQFSWAASAKNIFQLAAFVLSRAGLELSSLSYSSTVVNHYPAFAIQPGDTGQTALERLLEMVPDVILFRGSRAYFKNPLASEAASYAYGTDHPLVEGRYHQGAWELNRAQGYGANVFGEAFEWAELERSYERLRQVHDMNLSTAAKAQDRAIAELRRQAISSLGGDVLVGVNCGQEMYDVIEITDSRAGLAAAKRRLLSLRLIYSAKQGLYRQQLGLGSI